MGSVHLKRECFQAWRPHGRVQHYRAQVLPETSSVGGHIFAPIGGSEVVHLVVAESGANSIGVLGDVPGPKAAGHSAQLGGAVCLGPVERRRAVLQFLAFDRGGEPTAAVVNQEQVMHVEVLLENRQSQAAKKGRRGTRSTGVCKDRTLRRISIRV